MDDAMQASLADNSVAATPAAFSNAWPEGVQVRLKSDPGQVGTCTGRTRKRGDTIMVQVRFVSGPASMYPEYELESVQRPFDQDDDLRRGSYGRAADLRRQLTHIQLSGRLANLVYSMDTTNADFYAHQYKPVLAFLESPSNGLLIADEVGLGKTIEAGLIWTELRARIDARRLLVVCPKMLCEKWKAELSNRFGVEGHIIDAAELLRQLQRPKDQIPDGHALIASMQGIRPPKDWNNEKDEDSSRRQLARFFEECADQQPLVDLVIIDEAHYLRNPEAQTHKLGRLLRGVTEHIVLLTATPINIRNEDLFSLLTIVDADNFHYRDQFHNVLQANEPLVRARLLALAPDSRASEVLLQLALAATNHLLAESKQLRAILADLLPNGNDRAFIDPERDRVARRFELRDIVADALQNGDGRRFTEAERVRLADRIEKVNLLSHAVTRTRKIEVQESRVVRDARVQAVAMSDAESALYSAVTEAVRNYADEKGGLEGFLLVMPQRQLSSCMYAAARHWGLCEPPDPDELLYEDLGYSNGGDQYRSEFLNYIASRISGIVDLQNLRINDSKFTAFSQAVQHFLSEYPEQKVVVFSYFRDTLKYLYERLAMDCNIGSIVLMGGANVDKNQIINRFRTDKAISVLLSSEIASEGVDLQFSRFLVNYDLPWNPMKVEQRIGRLDRLGQHAEKIMIWNLVYADTIDSRILERLYGRLKLFERALGGLEAVIGEKIQALARELLTGKLTREQEEARILQTALALEDRRRAEEELEQQAGQLIAHSGYVLQKIHAAHDFSRRITESDLIVYVRDYLDRYTTGHVFFQPGNNPHEVDIKLPVTNAVRLEKFLKQRGLTGLTRLATGELCHCRFVNKVHRADASAEIISQFHPFVRFIAQEIDEAGGGVLGLICIKLSSAAKTRIRLGPGVYGAAVHRWYFEGLRTEEMLRARVVRLGSSDALEPEESLSIIHAARLEGRDWLEAVNEIEIEAARYCMEQAEDQLVEDYELQRTLKEAENSDRIRFQRDAVTTHLQRRAEIENKRIATLGSNPKYRGLVIASEHKIAKLREHFDAQLAKLVQHETITCRYDLICKCLVSVK